MICIVLKKQKTYDELRAFYHSNSFGDQFIEYVFETLDGKQYSAYSSHQEGSWLTTKDALRAEFETLVKRNHLTGHIIWPNQ